VVDGDHHVVMVRAGLEQPCLERNLRGEVELVPCGGPDGRVQLPGRQADVPDEVGCGRGSTRT
jgi:hypothetical protein